MSDESKHPDDISIDAIRSATAGLPVHLQNRLVETFDDYFRRHRSFVRGERLLVLESVTFTDGERLYTFRLHEGEWTLSLGAARRGAPGRGPWETRQICSAYRSARAALEQLKKTLPETKTHEWTLESARSYLQELVCDTHPVLRVMTVLSQEGRLVLAAPRGVKLELCRESDIDFDAFLRGEFMPSELAYDLVSHAFDVSRRTISEICAKKRRGSKQTRHPSENRKS